MPKVHGVGLSPFVRKVRVAMAEKNLPYELVPVFPGNVSDEFAAMSPLRKIPVYEDGGFTLPDSSVIIAYLERIHPKPSLYPADPQSFGRALFLEEYADTRFVERVIPPFRERVVNARFFKKEPDEAAVEKALAEGIPEVFTYVESQLDDSSGIVNGSFSVADIAFGTHFVNLLHAGVSVDASRFPKLAEYVATILARPSFKGLLEEEQAFFK